jgi:catechol 2,3-dioxygenase-like lactoylglutathione lyase family enzyme
MEATMIKRLAHVCLMARNLDEVQRFYCEGLGLTKKFSFIRDGEEVGFYLEVCDGNYLEVFHTDDELAHGCLPIRHFCLEVDDIEEIENQLVSLGYKIRDKKLGMDRSYQAWIDDPSGVQMELHQYTDASSQITGEHCVMGKERKG